MAWPVDRPRRLRDNKILRALVSETVLTPQDLIYPVFIVSGSGRSEPIPSLPGQSHLSPDMAADLAVRLRDAGGKALMLFGLPDAKDETGSSGADPDGPVPSAVRMIKAACPEVAVITDVCLCEYTSHGHCGLVAGERILNDPTLPHLAAQAMAHARAGADMVAPSDMMDGRVGAIRAELDKNGFEHVPIMSYSAKYASAFYGPFRSAAGSAPAFGDRRGYQMDVAEGADIVMVKPAGPYLDIIRDVREATNRPLAAYQVSGEYAMLRHAAAAGALDYKRAALESLVGIKRAGADLILTYLVPEVLAWLSKRS